MKAYRVHATYSLYGEQQWLMLVLSDGNSKAVSADITSLGFTVKKVSAATAEDVSICSRPDEVLKKVKDLIRLRHEADLQRKQEFEAEKERGFVESQRRKAAEREEAEHRRQSAISKATADLFQFHLEPAARDNNTLAIICAKVELFYNSATASRKDIFTSISLDFATLQATFNLCEVNRVMAILVSELNNCLLIDNAALTLHQQLRDDRQSVEGQVNSLASRSHIYGGSGDGLVLSWLIADGNARQDEKEMNKLMERHGSRQMQVEIAIEKSRQRQQFHEFRVKTIASLLLVACGKTDHVNLTMPQEVEDYLTHG